MAMISREWRRHQNAPTPATGKVSIEVYPLSLFLSIPISITYSFQISYKQFTMPLTHHLFRASRTAAVHSTRSLTTTSLLRAEVGSHAHEEKDAHNVQQDAVKDAKDKKNKSSGGDGGAAVSQKSGGENEKAKSGTKAPGPVIGMNDERGGVSWTLFPSCFCSFLLFGF